jgi:uncharacterized repeat protein (TIGR03847 family)
MDLGVVRDVHAESFGEPGNRTFRLIIPQSNGSVSLWLEKEQVVMLGSAIRELLRRVPGNQGHEPAESDGASFLGEIEARVGSLAVGYDPERMGFSIEASDFISAFELESIRFMTDRSVFEALGDELQKIASAGRPRCPLCGRPLTDEPHFCPPSNGHARLDG